MMSFAAMGREDLQAALIASGTSTAVRAERMMTARLACPARLDSRFRTRDYPQTLDHLLPLPRESKSLRRQAPPNRRFSWTLTEAAIRSGTACSPSSGR